MIKIITSTGNPLIANLLKLQTAKGRVDQQAFLISGHHLLKMALEREVVTLILTTKMLDYVDAEIEQIIVSDAIIKKLAQQVTPQGVVGVCRFMKQEVLTSKRLLYLDGVSDPGNVGTIMRSALAFNLKDLMFGRDTASVYNPKTISASQGALFNVNIHQSTIDDLRKMKQSGYRLIGTLIDPNAKQVPNYRYPDQCVVIFGSEGQGIRQEIIDLLDERLYIPIQNIDSLNVAMAATIIIYDMSLK